MFSVQQELWVGVQAGSGHQSAGWQRNCCQREGTILWLCSFFVRSLGGFPAGQPQGCVGTPPGQTQREEGGAGPWAPRKAEPAAKPVFPEWRETLPAEEALLFWVIAQGETKKSFSEVEHRLRNSGAYQGGGYAIICEVLTAECKPRHLL